MSEFTLKNGMKLYYEEHGSGCPVILMHGWTSSHHIFSKPVRQLQKKARCIIYDHRGHSGSKNADRETVTVETLASDLNELIEGLSLSHVTLVGWSMGAATAMAYIREHGCSALRQVVLCDMTPRQINDADWSMGLYQGGYQANTNKINDTQDFLSLFQAFSIAVVPRVKKLPPFLLRHILKKRLKTCNETVLKSLSDSMLHQDFRDVIGTITVPLTYFYAVPGSLFSPKLAEWYRHQAKVPFKAVAFPDSTHMFISEHPKDFAREMEKLL